MLQNLESVESKINLLVAQSNQFNEDVFIEIINLLPENYSNIIKIKTEVNIERNSHNLKLLKILKERDLIKDHKTKGKSIHIYPIE